MAPSKSSSNKHIHEDPPTERSVLIDGWWYDLTGFNHPGGPLIDDFVGFDATVAFRLHHSLASPAPYNYLETLPRFRGPAPEMPLKKLGVGFYDELSSEVKAELKKNPGSRYSSGLLLVVAVVLYLLVLASIYFQNLPLCFVLFGLMPRTAEFCIHEALHFRGGAGTPINEVQMLMSDFMFHVPSPLYRLDHLTSHHVYTNSSIGKKKVLLEDPDLIFLLSLLPSSNMVILHPILRTVINLAGAYACPSIYVIVKVLCYVRFQLKSSVLANDPFPSTYFNIASVAVSGLSLSIITCVAVAGGWRQWSTTNDSSGFAALICLACIARSTLGFYSNTLMALMTHLSMNNLDIDPGYDHVLRQLTMSNDLLPESFFWSYFFNGLNCQTMHHLYPQLPWQDLPPLTKTLVKMSRKYKVPYAPFMDYLSMMKSTMRAIDAIGDDRPVLPTWRTLVIKYLTYEFHSGDPFA